MKLISSSQKNNTKAKDQYSKNILKYSTHRFTSFLSTTGKDTGIQQHFLLHQEVTRGICSNHWLQLCSTETGARQLFLHIFSCQCGKRNTCNRNVFPFVWFILLDCFYVWQMCQTFETWAPHIHISMCCCKYIHTQRFSHILNPWADYSAFLLNLLLHTNVQH